MKVYDVQGRVWVEVPSLGQAPEHMKLAGLAFTKDRISLEDDSGSATCRMVLVSVSPILGFVQSEKNL